MLINIFHCFAKKSVATMMKWYVSYYGLKLIYIRCNKFLRNYQKFLESYNELYSMCFKHWYYLIFYNAIFIRNSLKFQDFIISIHVCWQIHDIWYTFCLYICLYISANFKQIKSTNYLNKNLGLTSLQDNSTTGRLILKCWWNWDLMTPGPNICRRRSPTKWTTSWLSRAMENGNNNIWNYMELSK